MKKISLILVLLFTIVHSHSQNIKIKDKIVWVDNQECLKIASIDANNVEFTTLDESQTIILKFIRTGMGTNDGLYNKIFFVEQNKSFTTRSYIFTKKLLIEKLIESKVISDCKIDDSKIDKFIMKFDENIEENLIRY